MFAVALRWLPAAGAAPPGEAAIIGGVVRYGLLPACVLAAGQVPWLLLAFRRAVTEAADATPPTTDDAGTLASP